ncbi:MAG: hypothetical protein ABSE82_10105 [Nitrososphaerales archaeon]
MSWEPPLGWIHTSPRTFKISFIQGLFESAGEIDSETRTVSVCILPIHASSVFSLLAELDAKPVWLSKDPPIIRISVEDAAQIPVFSPRVLSDKFHLLQALLKN